MKRILSQFLVMFGALLLTLSIYQVNQYMQVSATVGPSLAQLSQLDAASAEAAGIDAAQIEQTKQLISGTTNSIMLGFLIDFVLGIVFLLAGYFAYPEKG
ncbi:TPA: hypothetical protein HA244_06025 [Candidatus Micrarchaeota archaeon]|nr:hypothetical protein [Candidatus Micrarchaeota archaeon]